MALKFKRKRQINVMKVVMKLAIGILGLYAGGYTITILGQVMEQTESQFYGGLKLIGWTVGRNPMINETHWSRTCENVSLANSSTAIGNNCLTNTNGNGGILAVVGIIAVTLLVLTEFVDIQF